MDNHYLYGITRRRFLWLTSMSAAGILSGCSENPATGEKQFMIVSEKAEIRLDKENSPHQIASDYGILQDKGLNHYIDKVGNKLVPMTHRPKMPYSFQGVNATYINAYAFPGGTIAATRGILLKLENEAELAALLGHELGHVNARHTARQMSKRTLTSIAVWGIKTYVNRKHSEYTEIAEKLGMLGAGALLASYSRDNEREADALGNAYMVKAGYSTKGFVGLMEMLMNLSKRKSGITQLLFSTHPMSDERYRTAIKTARSEYQASQDMSLNRERYMDETSRLRNIRSAIEDMQKGDLLMASRKFDNAENYYGRALKQAPDDYAGLLMMAKCMMAKGERTRASRYAEQAKQICPSEAQAYHISGFIKMRGKEFDAAYNDFGKCDKLLPGNPNIAFFKGYALDGMNRKRQAAAEYVRYLKTVQEGSYAKHAQKRLEALGY